MRLTAAAPECHATCCGTSVYGEPAGPGRKLWRGLPLSARVTRSVNSDHPHRQASSESKQSAPDVLILYRYRLLLRMLSFVTPGICKRTSGQLPRWPDRRPQPNGSEMRANSEPGWDAEPLWAQTGPAMLT